MANKPDGAYVKPLVLGEEWGEGATDSVVDLSGNNLGVYIDQLPKDHREKGIVALEGALREARERYGLGSTPPEQPDNYSQAGNSSFTDRSSGLE